MGSENFRNGEYKIRGDYHAKLDPTWFYYLTHLEKLSV